MTGQQVSDELKLQPKQIQITVMLSLGMEYLHDLLEAIHAKWNYTAKPYLQIGLLIFWLSFQRYK